MIDAQDFLKMREMMAAEEATKDRIADISREILRMSKQIIYSIHRNDMQAASELFGRTKEKKDELSRLGSENPRLAYGMYSAAMQEYAEAVMYLMFVTEDRIPSRQELDIYHEDYLMGASDLTGELERKAVFSTIEGDYPKVQKIKSVADEIYHEFLKFDLKNSELRKKSDSIKWNLKRIDEILYDLKLKEKI